MLFVHYISLQKQGLPDLPWEITYLIWIILKLGKIAGLQVNEDDFSEKKIEDNASITDVYFIPYKVTVLLFVHI